MELTIETLTPENRDKCIGKSLYRIVRNYDKPPYMWGIFESYNNWETAGYACWSTDLTAVLKVFNAFNDEQAFTKDIHAGTPLSKRKYPKKLKMG